MNIWLKNIGNFKDWHSLTREFEAYLTTTAFTCGIFGAECAPAKVYRGKITLSSIRRSKIFELESHEWVELAAEILDFMNQHQLTGTVFDKVRIYR